MASQSYKATGHNLVLLFFLFHQPLSFQPTTHYWQEILPNDVPTPAPWKYGYPARLPNSQILILPIRQTTNPSEAVASLLTTHAAIDVTEANDSLQILPNDVPTPAPWKYGYPARLPNSQILILPIRQTTNPSEAVASLLTTHAAIDVTDKLGEFLADIVREYEPEVIVGLPTLGLTLARTVAKSLSLKRYIPLGYSQKFWYTDALSTEVSSVTSPNHLKKIYLDPNQVPLLRGKKVFIIDDAISTGKTLMAAWKLLESEQVGCEVIGAGVVMKQGDKWRDLLGMEMEDKLVWVVESPLLKKVPGGWDIRD
ncbi:related to Phosphoribosyltransferase, putative [Phialocephala subalpina]|uniref:Related to Phosphoribosyltransferase, putative n=1 Tax=Phialocephala subalpina TaxID=576137 RepID=A0A1L7WNG8_9HELO|nr:related to Phosphoribosyltransferase, putative [Phialocephala subalpina]